MHINTTCIHTVKNAYSIQVIISNVKHHNYFLYIVVLEMRDELEGLEGGKSENLTRGSNACSRSDFE